MKMHKVWNNKTKAILLSNTTEYLNEFKKIAGIVSSVKDLDIINLSKKFRNITKIDLPVEYY